MSIDERARALLQQMTLEEKASLCSGQDFWSTRAIARLQLPSVVMSDGPHGLRKVSEGMMGEAMPATCFPTAAGMAASWDPDLIERCGRAMALEARANDVHVILGPGVNMKRSPLGGRNFEYFSEDPVLSGSMAIALIHGIQSEGIGVSLKHFAANNQETERFTSSSEPDARTLHEIYLRAFEMAVTQARPWSVMAAYNKLYGTYASENPLLLDHILRQKWGYRGVVVSDWGAVHDRVAGLRAGLHLEMPAADNGNAERIIGAVHDGTLAHQRLDELVFELVRAVLSVFVQHRPGLGFDPQEHHGLAGELASQGMVLLKNEGGVLPLDPKVHRKVALIGGFAKHPRYQGSGSSQVNPTRLSDPCEALIQALGDDVELGYHEGYAHDGSTTEDRLAAAVQAAASADVAVVMAGVPETFESEGFDRETLALPDGHDRLIAAVAKAQPRCVVVLMSGSAVTMPWVADVPAILHAWLGGQATGEAIAAILSGTVNPSGKLSETFPVRLAHTPAHPYFPARDGVARYGEGLLIGYRYYDTKDVEPLFPFGHGLSYTTFAYRDLEVERARIKDTEPLSVSVAVTNTGTRFGREVVQLYVRNQTQEAVFPEKELKHFAKVALEPGETKRVSFQLGFRDFAYYAPALGDWVVAGGAYELVVGASSRDLRLFSLIEVEATRKVYGPLTRDSLLKHVALHPQGANLYNAIVESVATTFGFDPKMAVGGEKSEAYLTWERTLQDTLLHKFVETSEGKLTHERLDELLKACMS